MRRSWHAALLALAACGGTGNEGPADNSPQSVCAFYAEKSCAREEKCEPSFEGGWNDLSTCQERITVDCISNLTAPGVNDTPSRITVCANALGALSCDKYVDYEHWPEMCTPPPGQLADGAPCIVDGQCQGGACEIRRSMPCGVCKTVSAEGGPCSTVRDCRDLLACIDGACVAHPRTGEPCDAMDRYCVAGSVCKNVDAAGNGTCGAPIPSGGKCDPVTDECDWWRGAACESVSNTCVDQGVDVPIGARCDLTGGCNASGYCGSDFTCKPLPHEGQPCIPGQVECAFPAHCFGSVCKLRDAAVCK